MGMERSQRLIPDSLISEFRTVGGRRVYDGGGVMPDVRLDPQYSSRFAITLYSAGLIDDFVGEWSLANRDSREVEPGVFALTDEDWAAFIGFMKDKKVDYESATGSTIDHLRRVAEYERYLTPQAQALIDSLAVSLRDDTPTNLTIHRAEIADLIEDAIVLRTHYQKGVMKHNLATDKTLAQALEVLGNRAEYRDILTSRDTDRR
jgi:carboxyl-terminal processing protease